MKRRIYFLIVLGVMVFSGTESAYCGGVPTISVSELSQQLVSYLTQLEQYSQAIKNTSINAAQMAQLVRDYKQKLREYLLYLDRLESVRHMIKNKDWQMLMRTIDVYNGRSKRSVITTMDPKSPTYEADMNVVLENYEYVPRDPAQVRADAQALGIWTDEYRTQVEQDYNTYNLYKDRMRVVSDNAKKAEEREQKEIDKLKDVLNGLGDASDLATMQTIATQNALIIKQNEQRIKIANQQLMFMESQQAQTAARRAKQRDDEIRRLQNRKPSRGLGRDRWGSF